MGTLTPNRSLQVPTIGGDAGPQFAEEVNATITATDLICGGLSVLNVGGTANVTLTTDQAQNMIQQFTGVLTGNISIFAPAAGAFYAVENATTGNFSLSFGCLGGGNAQIIPQGLSTWLWTDGSFTRLSNPPGWQEIATYTASGASSLTVLMPGPFRRYRLTINAFITAGGANFTAQFSSNGGSTLITSGYNNVALFWASPTASSLVTGVATANISQALVANTYYDATMEIYPGISPAAGITWRSNGFGSSTLTASPFGENRAGNVAGFANAMQIAASAGTFSGTFVLEGLP